MYYLYEYIDTLKNPYEAFLFDTLVNDFPIQPHFHHYIEVLYMTEGSIIATVDGKDNYMSEGDMLFIFGDMVHSMWASSSKGAKYEVIKFDTSRIDVSSGFTPKYSLLLTAARQQGARVHFNNDDSVTKEWKKLFKDCAREIEGADIGFDMVVHSRISLFLTSLIRFWQGEGINFNNLSRYISREELSLQNVLEYIDTHGDENLRVEDLARRCNMSYSYFSRCFKDMYGKTCKEYLEMARIEKADELLKYTELSLNDISQELGYSDLSHFIRVYKRYRGVTPGAVR